MESFDKLIVWLSHHWFWGATLAAAGILSAIAKFIIGIEKIKLNLIEPVIRLAVRVEADGKISVRHAWAWIFLFFLFAFLTLALLVATHSGYQPTSGSISDFGFFVLILLVITLTLGVIALSGPLASRLLGALIDMRGKAGTRGAVMEMTFEKMMQAASEIAAQLYPPDRPPQKNIIRARRTYLVSQNFDTAITREDDYKALTDLHIERIIVGAEQHADPCEFLDDIDFKVRDDSRGSRVVYLPTRNTPFEKEVVLFFLPHIRPEEPAPRKIILTYKWPKMLRQLEKRGFEVGEWGLKSRDPIPEAEMRVFFEPGLRGKVKASIHGPRLPEDSLEEAKCDIPGCGGWEGWSYKLRNAPSGTYKIKFDMRRKS